MRSLWFERGHPTLLGAVAFGIAHAEAMRPSLEASLVLMAVAGMFLGTGVLAEAFLRETTNSMLLRRFRQAGGLELLLGYLRFLVVLSIFALVGVPCVVFSNSSVAPSVLIGVATAMVFGAWRVIRILRNLERRP